MTADPMLVLEGVRRDYTTGGATVPALRHVDLRLERGELVALLGRSGSGKTTLLSIAGGLDRPTAGRVRLAGLDLATARDDQIVAVRRQAVGYVFQSFGLLPILSAAENVEVPLRLARADRAERDARVRELLDRVGLAARAAHRPHELSGGEQQRVAIARALANRPQLLLADEPTGQLDSANGRTIMALLRSVVDTEGVAALVATHDPALVDVADRVLELRDGAVTNAADARLIG